MAKNKISEWSATPANNTDIGGIDIAEGCAPSGINNAIRELMAQVKDMQAGTDGDNFTVGGNLAVSGTSTFTGAINASSGITGNVTGNLTGNVTGNLTGNVTGNSSTSTSSTTATTATKATNLAGGGAGQIPYNTNADTTAFLSAGTSGQFLKSNGTSAPSWVNISTLTLDTAKNATGTSVDFTGIPSWVKRISIIFNGVSTNGTSLVQVQIGAGSVTTSGYTSSTSTGASNATSTTGLLTSQNNSAADLRSGIMTIINVSSNTWIMSANIGMSSNCGASMGNISLGGTLDRVRITTVNGTDTFDAGSINIMYE